MIKITAWQLYVSTLSPFPFILLWSCAVVSTLAALNDRGGHRRHECRWSYTYDDTRRRWKCHLLYVGILFWLAPMSTSIPCKIVNIYNVFSLQWVRKWYTLDRYGTHTLRTLNLVTDSIDVSIFSTSSKNKILSDEQNIKRIKSKIEKKKEATPVQL